MSECEPQSPISKRQKLEKNELLFIITFLSVILYEVQFNLKQIFQADIRYLILIFDRDDPNSALKVRVTDTLFPVTTITAGAAIRRNQPVAAPSTPLNLPSGETQPSITEWRPLLMLRMDDRDHLRGGRRDVGRTHISDSRVWLLQTETWWDLMDSCGGQRRAAGGGAAAGKGSTCHCAASRMCQNCPSNIMKQ